MVSLFFVAFYAAKVVKQHIVPTQYEDVVGDNMINLAVVLEDTTTQERFLGSEEFNIATPQLRIEVPATESTQTLSQSNSSNNSLQKK